MPWVFVDRGKGTMIPGNGIDIEIPAEKIWSDDHSWSGSAENCHKWDSAREAVKYMSEKMGYEDNFENFFAWMFRNNIQLEQL